MKKQTMKGCLTLGVALGAVALTQTAQAGDGSAKMAPVMGPKMGTMAKPAMSQPMMVTGKVNNYWTDASGYVTGVDLQTANGPAVVHFVPGMGSVLMQTYPIGSTADLWVQGSMQDGTQHWDLVGVGSKMPAAGFWPVFDYSGLDIATDWPMIKKDAERVTVEGTLKRVAVDKAGKVIGLVVETKLITKGTPVFHYGNLSRGETIWEAKAGGPSDWTLVRVGPEVGANSTKTDDNRVTPLMLNDKILATGYMEALRYGALSPYGQRVIGSAIVVNSQSVGQMGFPTMKPKEPVVFGLNINIPLITGKAPDVLPVVAGGYEVYNGSGGMMMSK